MVDVLYLNVRERKHELALLRATGWTEALLARLVLLEALGIALLGTVAGAGLGIAGMTWFAGGASPALVRVTVLVSLAAVIVTLVAGLLPALATDREPSATLLAEA